MVAAELLTRARVRAPFGRWALAVDQKLAASLSTGAFDRAPQGRELSVREGLTRIIVDWSVPWGGAPGYMIRDCDRIYGGIVTRRLRAMCIRDKPVAPGSPWQNGFAERLIGSIRREGLDHIVVFGEAHLRASCDPPVIEQGRADIARRRKRGTHYLSSDPGRTAPSIWPDLI